MSGAGQLHVATKDKRSSPPPLESTLRSGHSGELAAARLTRRRRGQAGYGDVRSSHQISSK